MINIFKIVQFNCRADNAVKTRTELENTVSSNEEHTDALDKQLVESKLTLVASEAKYDDISRKLVTLGNIFYIQLDSNIKDILIRI